MRSLGRLTLLSILLLGAAASGPPLGCSSDPPAKAEPTAPPIERCDSGEDDDGDGATDCQDSDCWLAGGLCPDTCSGNDEDADGAIDCDDPDCWKAEVGCAEICEGQSDEDGDGKVDCADSDCWTAGGACVEVCDSTDDEDGDGAAGCADSDCWLPGGACEEVCTGGADEDGDGAIDCEDADCDAAAPCIPTFSKDVQPRLLHYCAECHSEGAFFGGLSFNVYEDALLPSYYCPGSTKGQCSLVRILEPSMPQNCLGCVAQEDIDLIGEWISWGMPP